MVSIASLWELLLKGSKTDALVEGAVAWWLEFVAKADLLVLNINEAHVIALGGLPQIHRDPFDRILLGQSTVEAMPLVSKDPVFSRCGARIMW